MTNKALISATACAFIIGSIAGGWVVSAHYETGAQQDRAIFER